MVLGSVAGASLAAFLCGTLNTMPWSWWLLLPLTVWLIYTSDHLLDARRIGPGSATYRHQFHYRHFRALALLVILTGFVACVLILGFLPQSLLATGAWLGAAALVHLACAQWIGFRAYPAEAVIALLYTAGIWFGPLLAAQPGTQSPASAPEIQACIALFALSAFTNLLVFSLFERETDAHETPNRMVVLLGLNASRALLYGCGLLAAIPAGYLLWNSMYAAGNSSAVLPGIALLMFAAVLIPQFVYGLRNHFARDERYRAVCDGVFLLYALPALSSVLPAFF